MFRWGCWLHLLSCTWIETAPLSRHKPKWNYLLSFDAQFDVSVVSVGHFHSSSWSATKGAHLTQLVSKVVVQDHWSTYLYCLSCRSFAPHYFHVTGLSVESISLFPLLSVGSRFVAVNVVPDHPTYPSVLSLYWNCSVFFYLFFYTHL